MHLTASLVLAGCLPMAPVLPPKPAEVAAAKALQFVTALVSFDGATARESCAHRFFDGTRLCTRAETEALVKERVGSISELPAAHRNQVAAYFLAVVKPTVIRVERFRVHRKSLPEGEPRDILDHLLCGDDFVVWMSLQDRDHVFYVRVAGKAVVVGGELPPSLVRFGR